MNEMLTGKSGESFRRYFAENFEYENPSYMPLKQGVSVMEGFCKMPFCMQYGVYIDWLDSEGLEVIITLNYRMNFTFSINGKQNSLSEGFRIRSAARKAALENANAFFNLKQNKLMKGHRV